MSGPTRPIPISQGRRSQRSSPPSSTTAADASPNGMISQSCPVNHNGATYFHQRPPRAPVIGSLPEPSFLLAGGGDDEMPELLLPPPAQPDVRNSTPRQPSVIQVASSCPGDIGFFRHGSPASQPAWTISPRASDEFDLSKSPALAVMSAMRQARRNSIDSRRNEDAPDRPPQRRHPQTSAHGTPQPRRIPDSPYRPAPSNSFVASSHFLFEEDDDQSTEGDRHEISVEGLSLSERASYGENGAIGLPPRRPERRGSYDGGIFHFEDSE